MTQGTVPLPGTGQVIALAGVIYIAAVGGIAFWASRRTRNPTDFYAAGRGIGIWTTAIASMAATISGFSFIGGPGLVYQWGFGAVWIVLPLSVTAAMSGWVLATRLRLLAAVRDVLTVPDAIHARYRSRAAQGLSAAAIVIAVVSYLATNVLALGVVMDGVFGMGLIPGIWLGALITLAYSATGGILAGVYADLFQGALMCAASLMVFAYVLGAGHGFDAMSRTIHAADPAFLSPWGTRTPLAAMSFFFVFGIGTLGQPHVITKYYMIRDPRQLKWHPLIMTASMIVAQLLFIGVGMVVKALVLRGELSPLARPDDATPAFLLGFTPVALAALVFAGVAAAIMSTVNSFLNVGAAALTRDIPLALGRTPEVGLAWGRFATVAIALAAAAVATLSDTLVAFLGIFGWGLFASTLVPSLAMGLSWRRATWQGAVASIATGMVVTLGLETLAYFRVFTFPAGVTATALALTASILVFAGVSLLTSDSGPTPDMAAIIDVDRDLVSG